MEQIVIEVDSETAQKWKQAPAPVKETLQNIFRKQIDDTDRRMKIMDFKKLLDEISMQAQANGLTEEILQQILNEE